jgi:hypothetical protein
MATREQTTKALKEYSTRNGHPAMRQLLETTAGVSAISEIPEDMLGDVLAAALGGGGDATSLPDATAVYARWNASGKRRMED